MLTGNNEPRQYTAALDAGTGALLPFNPSPSRRPAALTVDGDQVWLAGRFTRLGAHDCDGLAAVDAETGAPAGTAAVIASGSVETMCVTGPWLMLGGTFDELGVVPSRCLGAIDRTTGHVLDRLPLPTRPDDVTPTVRQLHIWGDLVWIRGDFTTLGGAPRAGLAALQVPTAALVDWPSEDLAGDFLPIDDQHALVAPRIDLWSPFVYWNLTRHP